MAMSFVNTSAWVFGTAAVTPTVPTNTAAGDYVVISLVSKYDDAVLGGAPAGWDDLGTAINTGRSAGVDNGNLRTRCFGKVWQAGDSMPSLAPTPNNVSGVHATTYRSATGGYSVEAACVADDTVGSPLATGAEAVSVTSGDIVHIDQHLNGDAPTFGTTTVTTAATEGAVTTNTADINTTTGTDLRVRSVRVSITAGSGTTTTVSTTLAGTTTNAVGTTHIVRLREAAPAYNGSAPINPSIAVAAVGSTWVGNPTGGGGNITVVDSTLAENAAAATLTVTKPTGVANNDFMVAFVTTSDVKATTIPSGWTEEVTIATSGVVSTTMYSKRITNAGTEPADYTWSGWTSGRCSASIAAFRGVDTTTAWDTTFTSIGNQTGTTLAPAAITTVTANAMLVAGASQNSSSGSITAPANWVQDEVSTVSVGRQHRQDHLVQAAAGSTGTQTWTFSGTLAHNVIMGALRPAAPAISFVGTATTDYTATTPTAQAVSMPTHQAGDLILLFVAEGTAGTTITVNWTGATQVGNPLGGSDQFTALWYKIAASGSESATWSTTDASSRSSVVTAAYRGVDATNPIDVAVGFTDSPAGTTHTIPSQTVTEGAWMVSLASLDGSAGLAQPQFTEPSGWTKRLDYLNNTADNYASGLADTGPLTAGTKSGHTWTTAYADRAVNVTVVSLRRSSGGSPDTRIVPVNVGVAISAEGSITGGTLTKDAPVAASVAIAATGSLGGTVATLNERMVGIGKIKVKTTDATSVRLKIGTDTAVSTGVTYTSPQTPDGQGYTMHDVSGYAAGSVFYYRVAMTASGETLDTETTVGRFKTAPTSGGFSFCFGSCSNGDSAAMLAIANREDDLFFHTGDFVYADGSGTSLANFRTQWTSGLARANHAKVFATTPSTFGPSDHDGMQNNWVGTGDTTARDNYNTVVREKTAQVPVPSTTGTYFAFEWGPICFIVTDGRSFKSANAATDNSSKTVFGATQKQWIKDTALATTKKVIIIVGDVPLTGAANVDDDEWNNYNTERQELFGYLNSLAPGKKHAYLHGDMHALGADDGTNSGLTPGVPSFCGAPLNQTFSVKAGPYTAGTYPSSGTPQAYGRITVSETATSVTLAYVGYTSDNVSRITQTTVFNFPLTKDAPVSPSVTIAATGSTGVSKNAAVNPSVAIAATGTVSNAAPVSPSVTIAATGVLGTYQSAPVSPSVAIAASGVVSKTEQAPRSVAVTISASGAVSASADALRTVAVAIAATGGVAVPSGDAARGVGVTIAATGGTGYVRAAPVTPNVAITATSQTSLAAPRSVSVAVAAVGSTGLATTAVQAVSVGLTGSGVVGKYADAPVNASVALVASGIVSKTAAADVAVGVVVEGSGSASGVNNAVVASTVTLAASGVVNRFANAPVSPAVTISAVGVVNKTSAAPSSVSVAITSAGGGTSATPRSVSVALASSGVVGKSSAAPVNVGVAITSAGQTTVAAPRSVAVALTASGGPTAVAPRTVAVGIAATGLVLGAAPVNVATDVAASITQASGSGAPVEAAVAIDESHVLGTFRDAPRTVGVSITTTSTVASEKAAPRTASVSIASTGRTSATAPRSVGVAITATAVMSSSKAASVPVGVAIAALGFVGQPGGATVGMGVAITATGVLGHVRDASVTVGVGRTATGRAEGASSRTVGVALTASGQVAKIASAPVSVGVALEASGTTIFTGDAHRGVGVSITATSIVKVHRDIKVTISEVPERQFIIKPLRSTLKVTTEELSLQTTITGMKD